MTLNSGARQKAGLKEEHLLRITESPDEVVLEMRLTFLQLFCAFELRQSGKINFSSIRTERTDTPWC